MSNIRVLSLIKIAIFNISTKSSNEKRSEICIREQFVTRMVRYGGGIETFDFDKGNDANVEVFGMYLLLHYKCYWCLEEFWREVPK